MIHMLETSLLNLSDLIKKETQNEYLSNIARQLATWSSHYVPVNQSFEDTDKPYTEMAYELDERLRNKEIVLKSPPLAKPKRRDLHKKIRFEVYTLIEYEKLKKRPLIKKLREKFPEVSSGVICGVVNKLLKYRIIEISMKHESKSTLIKGRYWRKE
jgi:hypothetical protein